jgi:AcrR family transcriptional regulator
MEDTRPDSRARLLAAAAEDFGPARPARRAGGRDRAPGRANERMIYHHLGSEDALYRAVLADQGAGPRERWLPYLRGTA